VTLIEQTSNPGFGRLVLQARVDEKLKRVLCAASGFLTVTRSKDKRSQNVRSNSGGSDCSLVAWVLGLSRFQRAHSHPISHRRSDASPALLQWQISHRVNDRHILRRIPDF
jgi:hypothetical protein